jgi:hypothetical protein
MVQFLNDSNTVGIIMNAVTYNVTGSETLTLIGVTLFLLLCFALFRVPFELGVIFILPIILIMGAYDGNFVPVVIVSLLLVGSIMAKRFLGW